MRSKVIALALVASAFAIAQQDKPSSFKDKAGNMSLANVGPWQLRFPDRTTASFKASGFKGGKLTGTWKSQGIQIVSVGLSGKAKVNGNQLTLESATMTGGYTMTSTKGESVSTVSGPSAEYNAVEESVETVNPVHIVTSNAKTGSTMDAKGSSAKVFLSKDQKGPLEGVSSATMQGPIIMVLTGTREEKDEKTGKVKTMPFRVDAKGSKMTYSAQARTITLTGNVVVNGDDPVFGGDIRANKAVITLTEKGEVESIDMDGPGETVYRDKKGGG